MELWILPIWRVVAKYLGPDGCISVQLLRPRELESGSRAICQSINECPGSMHCGFGGAADVNFGQHGGWEGRARARHQPNLVCVGQQVQSKARRLHLNREAHK